MWVLRDKKRQAWNKEYVFIEKQKICTFDSRLFTKEVQFLGIWLHDDHLFEKGWHSDCVAYDCKSKEQSHHTYFWEWKICFKHILTRW